MPIPLRTDFDATSLRKAARIGGVTFQFVRDWVSKFNAAVPDGLVVRKAPGQRSILDAVRRAALVEAIERGPI